MRVGAAEVDITPLPGVPMGGYALRGTVSRGHWLRLYAKALYVEDADGVPLVLVSVDSWSVSDGLADRVAEIVRDLPGGERIGRENLLLAATHSHHGVGGISSYPMYNSLSASRPGFDPELFEFSAQRIAKAVVGAAAGASAGRVYLSDRRVPAMFRNRAVVPFEANPESDAVLDANPAGDPCVTNETFSNPDSCRAVDSKISVLTLERNGHVIGAGIFLAVHPTAMGPNLRVYSSDIFGVASLVGGRALARRDDLETVPVLAFFNGAEGDVAPQWEVQDRANTLALGRSLAAHVTELADPRAATAAQVLGPVRISFDPAVEVAGREVEIPGEEPTASTALRISAGRAILAGARDGRTFLNFWPWRDGGKGPDCGAHGVMWPLLDPGLGCVRLPVTAFSLLLTPGPKTVPLGVYEIGELALASFPGEPTTIVGLRARRAVAAGLDIDADGVLLVGLANGYLSYFTTPEGYGFQFYEGASTLYGERSAAFLSNELGSLARCLRDSSGARCARVERPERVETTFDYPAGMKWSFGMETVRPVDIERFERMGPLATSPRFDPVRFCWPDEHLRLPPAENSESAVNPSVSIEVLSPEAGWGALTYDGFPEDNFGLNLVTLGKMRNYSGSEWCAFWIPPESADAERTYRFKVRTPGGEAREGAPFVLNVPG
jgi:neutral ceramidase